MLLRARRLPIAAAVYIQGSSLYRSSLSLSFHSSPNSSIAQWSQGCFRPRSAWPSWYALYISCQIVSLPPSFQPACKSWTYEEPHGCAESSRGDSVERPDRVNVDGVRAVGVRVGAGHCG